MKTTLLFVLLTISSFSISHAQSNQMWGVTSDGGAHGAGTIYSTNLDGTSHNVEFHFPQIDGEYPDKTGLVEGPGGILYGVTPRGGNYDDGIIFSYNPDTNMFSKLFDFNEDETGRIINNEMVLVGSKLYGTSWGGGVESKGLIFAYDLSNQTYNVIHEFVGSYGNRPEGRLIVAENGKMYGITKTGGFNSYGVIFSLDLTTNAYTMETFFGGSGQYNGESPVGWLTELNGKLYGMTNLGGNNNAGCIFVFDMTTNAVTKLYDFNYLVGIRPQGGFEMGENGKLYGLTSDLGPNGGGTLFELDPTNNELTIKVAFEDGSELGEEPADALLHTSGNIFYGMTRKGGVNDRGVVFKYEANTEGYEVLYHFNNDFGIAPRGHFMQSLDGKLYGLTSGGGFGIYGSGSLFSLDIQTNLIEQKFEFQASPLGRTPTGGLISNDNNKFYGVTNRGGDFDEGVLYSYNYQLQTYTKILDFSSSVTGRYPEGALMKASDGYYYGTTSSGGTNFGGVLYQFDPITENYTIKHHFFEEVGRNPYGQMVEASNGKIYGLTPAGAYQQGVLYAYDPVLETYQVKVVFSNSANTGSTPNGSLIVGNDGKLYGVTTFGGAESKGLLFQYDVNTEVYTILFSNFTNAEGFNPYGNLVEHAGIFYGTTRLGGTSNKGALYSYNPAINTFTQIVEFDGENGSFTYGSLMKTSEGMIYGTKSQGGDFNLGVLFQFNPETGIFTKKLDFEGFNGATPTYANLLEIMNPFVGIPGEFREPLGVVYPNPTTGLVNVKLNPFAEIESITILDVSGRVVSYIVPDRSDYVQFEIDEPAGLYFINLQIRNGGYEVIKLLKY